MKAKIIQGRQLFGTMHMVGSSVYVFDIDRQYMPVSYNGFFVSDLYFVTDTQRDHGIVQAEIDQANKMQVSLPSGFYIPKSDVQISIEDPAPIRFNCGLISRTAFFEGRTVHILTVYEDGRVMFYYGEGKTQIISADDAAKGLKTIPFVEDKKETGSCDSINSVYMVSLFTADDLEVVSKLIEDDLQKAISYRDNLKTSNVKEHKDLASALQDIVLHNTEIQKKIKKLQKP